MPIQVAALVSALAPALKSLIAAEALNLVKKYIFDERTNGAKMVRQSIYSELEKVLGGMDDVEWSEVLNKVNGNKKKSYKKKAGEWLGELLTSGTGTTLSAGGSVLGAYNSILADALGNALDSMTNPRQAAAWGNPYAAGASILGGGRNAWGAVANVVGDAAGGWFDNLSQQMRSENLQNRMTQMMLENRMTGEMLKQLRFAAGSGNWKTTNGSGGGGRGGGGGGPSGSVAPRPSGPNPRGGGGAAVSQRGGARARSRARSTVR